MQEHPLLISSLIRHAAEQHGDREIISREAHGESIAPTFSRWSAVPGGSLRH